MYGYVSDEYSWRLVFLIAGGAYTWNFRSTQANREPAPQNPKMSPYFVNLDHNLYPPNEKGLDKEKGVVIRGC